MSPLVRIAAAAALAVLASLTASCAGDSADRGSSSSSEVPAGGATWEDGEPVKGEVTVAWANLDPKYPVARVGLVNESSEIGQTLKSGKATSSEIRVLTDAEMGGLLAKMGELGFFQYAQDGLALDNTPDVAGKRGVVVVTQDGRSKGLMLTTNLGMSPVPKAYADTKKLVLFAHSQVPGYDVKANIGAPDERIFSAPPIRPKKP